MINIKTPVEIATMALGGEILADTMAKVLEKAQPGVSTLELDKFAEDLIIKAGGRPSFKMEKGYFYTTCMCVNDVVVHGIPSVELLKNGDLLGVDLGVFYKGWHTDGSWSKIVGGDTNKFLQTGELALKKAIEKGKIGNHIGDISKTIQEIVEGGGYSCVKQLVGHGVGKLLHEDPEIPCYLRGEIQNTALITEGMVLAVEIIYNEGKSAVVYKNDDGWSIATRDGSNSGLFEHTVAITTHGPVILTSPLAHERV